MDSSNSRRNAPIVKALHPWVYGLLAGSVLWIVLTAWLFFHGSGYAALQVAVVTGFAIAFVATPLALARLAGPDQGGPQGESFMDWCAAELDTVSGPVHGAHAAVMVLLAPLACAAGLTAISLIARLAAAGAI